MVKIETFKELAGYSLTQLKKEEPFCFNGFVSIEKYTITIEKVEEPKEVYRERLQKLWDECDNHHNWVPLKGKAKSLGIELVGNAGNKHKKR